MKTARERDNLVKKIVQDIMVYLEEDSPLDIEFIEVLDDDDLIEIKRKITNILNRHLIIKK